MTVKESIVRSRKINSHIHGVRQYRVIAFLLLFARFLKMATRNLTTNTSTISRIPRGHLVNTIDTSVWKAASAENDSSVLLASRALLNRTYSRPHAGVVLTPQRLPFSSQVRTYIVGKSEYRFSILQPLCVENFYQ